MDCLIEQIKLTLIRSDGKINTAIVRQPLFKASDLKRDIYDRTQFLPNDANISQRVYCILNSITSLPTCAICGSPAFFSPTFNKGYSKTCSSRQCIAAYTAPQRYENTPKKAKLKVKSNKRRQTSELQIVQSIDDVNGQQQISNYIKSIDSSIVVESRNTNVIAPYVADIFIPSKRTILQYVGLQTHSSGSINTDLPKYQLQLLRHCEQRSIRVIHIFEHEWLLKPAIVRSRINSILNRNTRIFARNCTVIPLNDDQSRQFFGETHIQGYISSQYVIGLQYNNTVVAAMSFSKPRYSKAYEWELLRYSSALNVNVIGGAGKLFKHFLKEKQPQPTTVVSYADKRWSVGNLYKQLGFGFLHDSSPNYFYYHPDNGVRLFSRVSFQKHKLAEKLTVFDPLLTESQNMYANGYRRIWDCGNSVWVWNTMKN